MLELGQPTHPYDLDQLGAPGLLVRRATPGEVVTTLDGVDRTLGVPGRGLGETGDDCLICDAAGTPVGIDIFRVTGTGIVPVIDGGLAGKNGGQIGAGILRAPMECFTAAAAAYREKYPD